MLVERWLLSYSVSSRSSIIIRCQEKGLNIEDVPVCINYVSRRPLPPRYRYIASEGSDFMGCVTTSPIIPDCLIVSCACAKVISKVRFAERCLL